MNIIRYNSADFSFAEYYMIKDILLLIGYFCFAEYYMIKDSAHSTFQLLTRMLQTIAQ
jgi:hypothetical protein